MAKKKNGNGKSNGHSNGNGVASRNKSLLGHNAIFTPEVMDDIHIKAELGRYRMRGMALMKKIPTFDDLVFLPGTLTRFVIEGYREKCETKTIIGPRCENPIELDIPVYITGMSFGALSYEAKTALARGATMAGSATCSGEGGMIPDERRYSEKWFYQCIQSRYGFNPHHAQLADGIEVFIGQGQKVGMGGHLMGQKVTDQVAEMRSLPAGIDQRSPARHPDWLGPDDLALKVQELRELTKIPIHVLILPKANQFIYSENEREKINHDIDFCKKNNIDGVVIGALENNTVDRFQMKKIIKTARPMNVTFHRAFDTLNEIEKNLHTIIELGCNYLLTSGQMENVDLGKENIEKTIQLADNNIKVIAGGGVNIDNIESLYKLGVREFHLSSTLKNIDKNLETNYEIIRNVVKKLKIINNQKLY